MNNIVAVVHTHGNPDLTWDTVASIRHYVTDRVLVIVDEAGWKQFDLKKASADMLKGFYHGCPKAPYRNIILSLLTAARNYLDFDWIFYTEADALVGSAAFLDDLHGFWVGGNDFRCRQSADLSWLGSMLHADFEEVFYLLGAFMFYHKDFIKKCMEEDFFERFLYYTNDFRDGFFPGYGGWDLTEHMMPTLATHWGGGVKQFAKWCQPTWFGDEKYPARWQPELSPTDCDYKNATILHPLKEYNGVIRSYHRGLR